MSPAYWSDAKAYLSAECPIMKGLIHAYSGEVLVGRGDAFYTLLRSIVGQQISVKAADFVWHKLISKVKPLTAEKLLRTRDTTLRAAGLSGQKVLYCKELARYFKQPHVTSEYFLSLDDAAVLKELVAIKGIGVWTAEMFLLFHLQRPDIYPLQDIGMIKALEKHYAGGRKLSKAEIVSYGERWRPYRSVATWYLWRSLDPVPVAY